MYTHNLDPVLLKLGFLSIHWYSLAYIFGIVFGWLYAKKLIKDIINKTNYKFNLQDLDDYISYLIFSIILGGRIGYILFYNFEYYSQNLLDTLKIWEGGMSFHGALIGIVLGTFIFANKKKVKAFILLDIVACTSPIGIFLGRLSNFINAELYGKPTEKSWGVIFPNVDNVARHPSQIYEAFLEGIILFIILLIYFYRKKKYRIYGAISGLFLIFYSIFRFLIEYVREPDLHLGLFLNFISMGQILCIPFFIFGILIIQNVKQNKN